MVSSIERQESILQILKNLKGLEPLKKLFWTELNYERVNQQLSRAGWTDTAAESLAEDPILFAGGGQNNDFKVIYNRLNSDNLLLTQERPVVTKLLRDHPYSLFVFSNKNQDKWHFINVKYDTESEKRRLFRRITVSPEERLRTASERVACLDLDKTKKDLFGLAPLEIQKCHDEAFDVEAVTKQFFCEYSAIFGILEKDLDGQTKDHSWAHDYSLQFLNRTMFLYFIQRKGWLGNDREFLRTFWESYQSARQPEDSFVEKWLNILFFEAFNNKFHGGHKHFPSQMGQILALAPYLNGGLFTENKLDQKNKAVISDKRFAQIFKFLERYNFTIAEDSPLDKEVAVDPEMIGKVYESMVNVSDEIDERGEAGIVYTPRTEIDLMCRLALVDNLTNHLGAQYKSLFYQLVFSLEPEEKAEADRAVTAAGLWQAINKRLQETAVLDTSCGSGSFLVGMLHIMDDLQERANRHLGLKEDSFTRKKRIIGQSLYGVDVMEWACQIAELRLWLALIVDAEIPQTELHVRKEPLLPHFTFKIRCGDSLVQEVGGINLGHIRDSHLIPPSLKARITKYKNEKLKFYNNTEDRQFCSVEALQNEERSLFLDILSTRQQKISDEINVLRRKIEGPLEKRINLFDGKVEEKPRQIELDAPKARQQVDDLNMEHERLENSKKALATSPHTPFVWDIAFVEIFEDEKGGFDIVVGNPPYVRQEVIAAPLVQGMQVTKDKKEYKDKLAYSVYRAFPRFFGLNVKTNSPSHKLDAKSDLYIYFYFRSLSLLNEKGSFCFITSNSWLDVGYGADLQEFLLKHCHVKLILDNQYKRSFANADVNSVIALLSAPDESRDCGLEKMARFARIKVPFEHILDPVIVEELDESRERKSSKEYRIFPIQQSKLLADGCEMPCEDETEKGQVSGPLIKATRYIGNKWGGKYLRAPDIFVKTIERFSKVLIPLPRIIHKDYGIKPGCVDFFYVDQNIQRDFNIEEEFLLPTINSSRYIESLYFYPNTKLFCCDKNKKEIKGTGALKYIEWGEVKGYGENLSVKAHRPFWYSLKGKPADLLMIQFWDKRFWTPIAAHDRIFCSNNFFFGRCLENRDNLFVQMNTSWYFMQIELFGRANQGQGVLTTYGTDFDQIKFIPASLLKTERIRTGLDLLDKIAARPIGPIWDEIRDNDHNSLDNIVFDALDFGDSERHEFQQELIELVKSRLIRANSVS